MRAYWRTIRGFSRDIWRYLAFNTFWSFAYMGSITVLMNLYLLRLGYDTVFIGGLTSAGMLVWGMLALPAGALGSRWGLKTTVLRSMVILSLGALLMVLFGWLAEPWRAPALVAAWIILWAGAALVSVNSLPFIMALTDDENRSYVFSVQQVLSAVATLVGALISGSLPGLLAGGLGVTLAQPVAYQLALLLAPAAYLLAGWFFMGVRDVAVTRHAGADGKSQPAPWGIFVLLLLIVVMQSANDGSTRTFFNLYLDQQLRVPVASIGAILGLAQVFPALLSLFLPAMIHRMGSRGAMLANTVLGVGFSLLLALAPNTGAASAAYMGLSCIAAALNTTRSIFCQEVVSARWRATSSAVVTIAIAIGWALSAWQGGALIESLGFRGLFLAGSAAALLASLFTLMDAQRAKQAAAVSPLQESILES